MSFLRTLRVAALVAGVCLAATAQAATITGGGLDAGYACESTQPSADCQANADFNVVPVAATTGTLNWTGPGLGTASINVTVPNLLMTGSFDGVGQIIFTGVNYSVSGWSSFDDGSTVQGLGSQVGTVIGFYEQRDAGGNPLVASTPFSVSTQFANLVCPSSGVGLCSFSAGFFRDFALSVQGQTLGATPHDFVHVFNVVIPEPASAALLGLGLLAVAGARRRR